MPDAGIIVMTASGDTFMQMALRLGRRNRGATAENPSVGCILTNTVGGRTYVVGRGWTQPGGRPHAEAMALAQAGSAAEGATAYVTLEPCAHQGKTPPCADALVAAGVARVIIAVEDPDPRVAGRGIARLQDACIAVETGPGAEEARHDLAGFLSRIEKKRPYVTLKLAISQDGRIAAEPGVPTQITGSEARAATHLMRARSDAILVGRNTVESDDPQLTCRLPGLEDRSPVRVVLDSALGIPHSCRLLQTAGRIPVWIYCARAPEDRRKPVLETGAEVISLDPDADGYPALSAVLDDLARRGINDLMVEGGAQVAESFLKADLVDRVALFTAPKQLGPGGVSALGSLPLETITGSAEFVPERTDRVGEDRLDWYRRKE